MVLLILCQVQLKVRWKLWNFPPVYSCLCLRVFSVCIEMYDVLECVSFITEKGNLFSYCRVLEAGMTLPRKPRVRGMCHSDAYIVRYTV